MSILTPLRDHPHAFSAFFAKQHFLKDLASVSPSAPSPAAYLPLTSFSLARSLLFKQPRLTLALRV